MRNTSRRTVRRGIGLGTLALAAMLLVSAPSLAQGTDNGSPTAVPSASPKFSFGSQFTIDDAPPAYDLASTIIDFDPGTAMGQRTFTSGAYFSVVEGQLVWHQPGADDTSYGPGDKFSLEPGTAGSFENASTDHARLFLTTLTSPGSAPVQDVQDSSSAAPIVAFSGQATVDTPPVPFTLNQLIVDFAPAASSGVHQHNGVGMSIVMSGELTNRLVSGDLRQGVGDIFVDVQNRPTEHRNAGSENAAMAATYLNPVGKPAAVPAQIASSPATTE